MGLKMKTIVNFLFSFSLILSTTTIFAKDNMKNKNKPKENYLLYVNEIVNSFEKEMNDKYGFICIGTGGGMPYDVEEIFVKFQVYKQVNIEQARKLEIMATKRLQELVNNHKKIRPFLREYPFGTDRCHVFLVFCQKDNDYYTDGSIAYVFQAREKLHYFASKSNSKPTDFIFSEDYKKAKEIIEKDMNNNATHINKL